MIIFLHIGIPLSYLFTPSTKYSSYVVGIIESWWTNLHCFQQKRGPHKHRKHTRFKYTRRHIQRGLRTIPLIAIIVASPTKPVNAYRYKPATKLSTYTSYAASTRYSVSSHESSNRIGALVDRGANGGIAGNDVRIIATTDRRVDIQGVSNHQVTDIPIVTCGALVNTQRGDIIAIMNQYARVRNGKTIHSCVQLEAHKHEVDDKSIVAGGKQRIVTPDGYAIPLHVREGLVYMDMQPYTDHQFDTLPHVILTSDVPWDPTIFDKNNDDEQWFDAVSDLEHIADESPFNEYGEYRHTHEIDAACSRLMNADSLDKYYINSISTLLHTNERKIRNRNVNCDKYRSCFGWLPDSVITETFQNTTQFYPSAPPNHLRKRYKSPYPACNIPR